MKRIISILLLFAMSRTWSQTNYSKESLNNRSQYNVVTLQTGNIHSSFVNNINVKALRHFTSSFTDASSVMWRLSDNGSTVSFTSNNQKIISYYNNWGGHLFTIKTYTEKELDPEIASFVKNDLGADFSVYFVTEEIRGNDDFFEISLQSNHYWCKIKLLRNNYGRIEKREDNFLFLKS